MLNRQLARRLFSIRPRNAHPWMSAIVPFRHDAEGTIKAGPDCARHRPISPDEANSARVGFLSAIQLTPWICWHSHAQPPPPPPCPIRPCTRLAHPPWLWLVLSGSDDYLLPSLPPSLPLPPSIPPSLHPSIPPALPFLPPFVPPFVPPFFPYLPFSTSPSLSLSLPPSLPLSLPPSLLPSLPSSLCLTPSLTLYISNDLGREGPVC